MIFTSKIRGLIAIVPAITLALVLVTPDPTDDVDGLLHLCEQVESQAKELASVMDASSTDDTISNFLVDSGSNLSLPPSLPLLRNYRC